MVVHIIGIWIHLDSETLALKDLMHKLLLVSYFHVILGGWNYSDVVVSSRKSYFVYDFLHDMSWAVLLCCICFYNLCSHHQSEIRKQASHTLKYLSKRHFIYQAVFSNVWHGDENHTKILPPQIYHIPKYYFCNLKTTKYFNLPEEWFLFWQGK